MSFASKPMAKKSSSSPLPPRLVRLLRESAGLALLGVVLYLALILYGYDRLDPGWSHSGDGPLQNPGGVAGAWLADLLLYLFGISAWWWVLLFLYVMFGTFRRMESTGVFDRRPLFVSAVGFLSLLMASSGLEALRFYTLKMVLPQAPGGVLGLVISKNLSEALGFTGATLALLILAAIGFSLFTGLSWLRFVEKLGAMIEAACLLIRRRWENWQDRRAGAISAVRRDALVEVEKKRLHEHPPLHIEQPAATIPKSPRVIKEKQAPLFIDLPDSPLPPLHLLDEPAKKDVEILSPDTLEFTSRLIERKLIDFGVEVKVVAAYPGPVITRYEIEPAVGVKGNQILNLVKDLARSLSVVSIRVVETIPGKTSMGLEIPNPKRQVVRLSEILSSQAYADMASPLTIALGKDIGGHPVVADLARMPHVLVAGTTGSGKSVAINAMILSLIYKATPEQVRLILVDPKMLELSVYEGIPHLLAPVVTDMRQAASALRWGVAEMERRYKLMSALGVRNLGGYNQKIREAIKSEEPLTNPFSLTPDTPEPLEEMPLIVVVIDELADLMMVVGKKVEELIARLAQKARAAGVHLLLATQRPSVDVITGLIKANIPTRVAFQVSSKVDSRTILDQMGAEALLGQGDMLYLPPGTGFPLRVHGAFVADQEVHRVVEYLKEHGEPRYVDGVLNVLEDENGAGENGSIPGIAMQEGGEADPLYDEAVAMVLKSRRASISLVQRHLRIGYNRAARLIEEMERAGLVSAMQTNGNREVLVPARNE
ncbi:DNA translocase FtsK [Nitrosovibrio tenuis]|uniref:DNA translocase FtsK n=1 Tax=Nitrosovibrio tenuis TaxID=1233 RepID=A0A1H7RP66_9PROT|nr:DNA translocase FtsK [Nitrosovibrio tenuis]SEL61983.1 DNA translocase FtsK [Nitrosovibrio tenuis]